MDDTDSRAQRNLIDGRWDSSYYYSGATETQEIGAHPALRMIVRTTSYSSDSYGLVGYDLYEW